MSLEWIYSFDELRAYSVDTKQGKLRLESTIKHLPNLAETAGIDLAKRSRVLCLMAGSCIEGIAFATVYNAKVTCLDLQRQMLLKGQREARKRKLHLDSIVGDVTKLKDHVKDQFDLVTVLGSPLAHLSINDFDQVAAQVSGLLNEGGAFLVEQADMVFRIMPQYKDAFVPNVDPPVVNVHVGFSPREGYFERLLYGKNKQEVTKVFLWSPWIVEYVLKKNGLAKVDVKPWGDPFLMTQLFLFAARKG